MFDFEFWQEYFIEMTSVYMYPLFETNIVISLWVQRELNFVQIWLKRSFPY